MTTLRASIQETNENVAELTVSNPSPIVTFTSSKDYLYHTFGMIQRPRFLMEQPYSPDDAWSLRVDPTGALTADLPACAHPIGAELDRFFKREVDELSHRLLGALPSGRYTIVRSSRTAEAKERVLLGNEYVPAMLNSRTLCDTSTFYAAIFGANPTTAPSASGLLVGVAVLSSTGQNKDDAIWLFDLHGSSTQSIESDTLSVVLPLDGPLVVDAMAAFRSDPRKAHMIRERWSSQRGPAFVRWLAGESEAI